MSVTPHFEVIATISPFTGGEGDKHTFPYSRAIYSNRSSDSRRPAQKGVYHCFPFFYSRSASFIHKHGHNTSHRPFLSDLNKEMYAVKLLDFKTNKKKKQKWHSFCILGL